MLDDHDSRRKVGRKRDKTFLMAASPPADAAIATTSKKVPLKGTGEGLWSVMIMPGLYLPLISLTYIIGVQRVKSFRLITLYDRMNTDSTIMHKWLSPMHPFVTQLITFTTLAYIGLWGRLKRMCIYLQPVPPFAENI